MQTIRFDLTDRFAIKQGATWRLRLRFVQSNGLPLDLTSVTGEMELRESLSSVSYTAGAVTLDHDPTTGWLTLSLTPTQTAALDAETHVWDLLLNMANGDVWYPLEGNAQVKARSTMRGA